MLFLDNIFNFLQDKIRQFTVFGLILLSLLGWRLVGDRDCITTSTNGAVSS